ncbi:MAG: hypothetical protein AAGF59_05135 [Pseudomonadota bacterium]
MCHRRHSSQFLGRLTAAVFLVGSLLAAPGPALAWDGSVSPPASSHPVVRIAVPDASGPLPSSLPYAVRDHDTRARGSDVAFQVLPRTALERVRWETTTAKPVTAATAISRQHLRVTVNPKPGSQGVFLGFMVALFTISASIVLLMWQQVGRSAGRTRPGWETWRG